MSFTVRNLDIYLGRSQILHDLSFSLPSRGVTGIIGANGCGKSTLLRGLAGVLPAQSGNILYEGEEVTSMSPRIRARRIALLPQSGLAPPGLTVRQLVTRGRTPWLRPFLPMTPSDQAAVEQAMRAVGLTDLSARSVDSLSGGERQRAWIALVLAQESGIVLLDEPLNFLDLPFQAELVKLLRGLRQTCRIVIILHDLTVAARLCDHVLALKSGRLVASGPPSEVLTRDLLSATFGVDFDVQDLPGTGKRVVLPESF
ncbi:MAG: ABC transporter ATP-binding protein [Rhizobiaceae bacterium]|nr:ABC transporter ATP-binding protein [Rhizobiaceae bacterium]MBL4733544.1 ABC transporter ATP-binding protein [Rhizobiaceae bacterium]